MTIPASDREPVTGPSAETDQPRTPRVAVLGGGPVGLEAALAVARRGFAVQLYEAGDGVAHNVASWGHVRMFTPFGMNASEEGRAAVARQFGREQLPGDGELLTGAEFADRYLAPLSQLVELSGCIHHGTRVVAVSRSRWRKGALLGRPERGHDPFRLLLEHGGQERTGAAEFVLDCTGTWGNYRCLGAGGLPAVGERQCLGPANYQLPDILGRDRDDFADRTTLVVGSGYSAATVVVSLAELARQAPATRVLWVTNATGAEPVARIPDDRLLERDRLAAEAGRLAMTDGTPVTWLPGPLIEAIEPLPEQSAAPENGFRVSLRWPEQAAPGAGAGTGSMPGAQPEVIDVQQVVGLVGCRPDRSLTEELQIHECYVSGGPMKLAAALLGETSTDCLAQVAPGAETLGNPEPGYWFLGARSYGRDSRFLLRSGLEQIEAVLDVLSQLVSHHDGAA